MAKKKRKRQKTASPAKPTDQPIGDDRDASHAVGEKAIINATMNSENESTHQEPEAVAQSVDQIRLNVTAVVQQLLDKESATKERLKSLETKLKPLNQTVAQLKEQINLDQPHIIELWKAGKDSGQKMANKIEALHQLVVKQQARCEAIEIAMVRQCHALDAHTVQPSQLWEAKVTQEFTNFVELEKSVHAWLSNGEYRYLGIEPPEPIIPENADDGNESREPSAAIKTPAQQTSQVIEDIETSDSENIAPDIFDFLYSDEDSSPPAEEEIE